MAAENVGGNACGQTASFVNVSCAMPPEVVTVTWQVQSVVKIEDIAQARRRHRARSAHLRPAYRCRCA